MRKPNRKIPRRYVIRIYKMKYSFDKYDDTIYQTSESLVDYKDILVERAARTMGRMLAIWYKLFDKYEGYTYCIKDLIMGEVVLGGIMDPGDDDIIKEYIEAGA